MKARAIVGAWIAFGFLAGCAAPGGSALPTVSDSADLTPSPPSSAPFGEIALKAKIDFDDEAAPSCVVLHAEEEPGVDLWTRTEHAPIIEMRGGKAVLCGFENINRNACEEKRGLKWVHLILDPNGKVMNASEDPTSYTLSAGEQDIWMLGTPDQLPYHTGTSFRDICKRHFGIRYQ